MEKYIDAAVEQFRTLLNEQIARERKMEPRISATPIIKSLTKL